MEDYSDICDDDFSDEAQDHKQRGRRINKEKYCKKNKLGNGQYGLHEYANERCIKCNKVDPNIKNKEHRYG